MRDIICLVLATMLFGTTTLEAKAGAASAVPSGQAGTERKLTLKERILEVPPGTMIEVRLLNKQKIRGRLGELTNEGFSLTTAQGEKVETQKVAFSDLKSFKKAEKAKAAKTAGWIALGVVAVLVVISVVAYFALRSSD
jgi:cytochrome c-type biogenesis protein CcmH/NrfG